MYYAQLEGLRDMAEERREVFIGQKPIMNYALAALLQFTEGAKEVVLKARGRNISKAVGVAELLRNRFMQGSVDVKDIKIGTEVVGQETPRNVSFIEIVLEKKE